MMFQIFNLLAAIQMLAAVDNQDFFPAGKSSYRLELKVNNILISKGKIYVAIYNNAKDFMKTPCLQKSVPAGNLMSVNLMLGDLPEGDYCVTIYQDLNENGQIDKVFNMPTEPYGLSNNPNAFPTYENTKFHISKNTVIKIKLNN